VRHNLNYCNVMSWKLWHAKQTKPADAFSQTIGLQRLRTERISHHTEQCSYGKEQAVSRTQLMCPEQLNGAMLKLHTNSTTEDANHNWHMKLCKNVHDKCVIICKNTFTNFMLIINNKCDYNSCILYMCKKLFSVGITTAMLKAWQTTCTIF